MLGSDPEHNSCFTPTACILRDLRVAADPQTQQRGVAGRTCASCDLGAQWRAEHQQELLHGAAALQLSGSLPKPHHAAKPPVLMLSFSSPGPPVPPARAAKALGDSSPQCHECSVQSLLQGCSFHRSWPQPGCREHCVEGCQHPHQKQPVFWKERKQQLLRNI